MNALQLAARLGRKEIVKFILEEGADANVQDKNGNTALMHAVVTQ